MCRKWAIFLAVATVAGSTGPVAAAWITIKNDTNQPIVVQETCTVNAQVRRGKSIKLMPGETLREFQSCAGTKTLAVSETGIFGKSLGKCELSWKTDDQSFNIRRDGDVAKVTPPEAAKAAADGKTAVAKAGK